MYRNVIGKLILISLCLSYTETCESRDHPVLIKHHDLTVRLDPSSHKIECSDDVTALLAKGEKEIGFLLNCAIEQVELVNTPGAKLSRAGLAKYVKQYRKPIDFQDQAPANYYIIEFSRPDSVVHFTITYRGNIFDSLKTAKQEYARGFATTTGLIEERGVYLAGSSMWYPNQQRGTFTFKLKSYLPASWQSISQGEETLRDNDGSYQVNEWTCDTPMEEIYLIAGKYQITEEEHRGIHVMTYTYQDEPILTQKYREATGRYIDLYSRMIGAYPFKKFALVENFWQTGYGMPSFTLLGSQVIRLPFIIHTSYGHEILHNWWGNGVYVDGESGNWCEGLTNYLADHFYKKQTGDDASYRRTMLQAYLDYVQSEKDFPLSQFKERHDPATQAVGYNKSAMVFHMLYKLLGEECFFAAIKSFYEKYLFKKASWSDLENEFTTHYLGNDLSWFFQQWVTRTGTPALRIKDISVVKNESSFDVHLTLSQNSPAYQLLVPVRFIGQRDTMLSVFQKKEQESYLLRLQEKPTKIWVDPEFDLFRTLDRAEIPPALSQTLGATTSLILLPSAADQELLQAFQTLAHQWQTSENIQIKFDNDVRESELDKNALLILGSMNQWVSKYYGSLPDNVRFTEDEWLLDNERYDEYRHTVVLTTRNLGNPELSWTFIGTKRVEDLPVIGRKLPHYGKYGYLVFKGTENVAKGEWRLSESPLIRVLTVTESNRW